MENEAKIERLNQRLETVCDEYIELFCQKQGLSFEGWVGDAVGGEAQFDTAYFFKFTDIVLDLSCGKPKGLILKWYNYFIVEALFNPPGAGISYCKFVANERRVVFYPKPENGLNIDAMWIDDEIIPKLNKQ